MKTKVSIQVGFGCTGGQHQSVYFAERMDQTLRKGDDVDVEINHAAKQY